MRGDVEQGGNHNGDGWMDGRMNIYMDGCDAIRCWRVQCRSVEGLSFMVERQQGLYGADCDGEYSLKQQKLKDGV